MKKIAVLSVVILAVLALCLQLYAADAAQQIIKVKLLNPVTVNSSPDAASTTLDMSDKAMNLGLSNIQLLGKTKFIPYKEGMTKMIVEWNGIQSPDGVTTKALSAPLTSIVATDEGRIDAGIVMEAKGNVESFVKDLAALKEEADKKKSTETKEKETKQTTESSDSKSSLAPAALGTSGGTTNYASDDPEDDEIVDAEVEPTTSTSTEWADCAGRISLQEKRLYSQHKLITKDQDNNVIANGACEDTGEWEALPTDYVECIKRYDTASGVKYTQRKEITTDLEGNVLSIGECKDYGTALTIDSRNKTCSNRIDLASLRSYNQYYYELLDDAGLVIYKSDCEDTGSWKDLTVENQNCTIRVDSPNHQLVMQERELIKDDNGLLLSSGECSDGPYAVNATKVYGTPCNVVPDYEQKKVYRQYREIANYGGVAYEVNQCATNFDNYFEIKPDSGECSYRNDIPNQVSVKQEKLYYKDENNATVFLTTCQDSSSTFPHYKATCDYLVDWNTHKAYPQERTAFDDENNTTHYVTECAPDTSVSYDISEEFCSPKYDHDTGAATSYYYTRYYYTVDGAKTYLSQCARSQSTSFAHQYDSGSCAIINNDATKQSQYQAVTYINSPDDGRINITACQNYGAPVNYTYLGEVQRTETFYASTSWTVPSGVSNVHIMMISSGGYGGIQNQPGEGNGGAKGAECVFLGCGMDCTTCAGPGKTVAGGGGGGGGGEKVEYDITVSPGSTVTISMATGAATTITANGNTYTARYGMGAKGGDGSGPTINQCCDGSPKGGAGGAGVTYNSIIWGTGGAGYPEARTPGAGLAVINYMIKRYSRADGTVYESQ